MRRRFQLAAIAILLVFEALAFSQYPPGQYPPGQYPPGQYPPNTYPDNYPARLPGGIPINLPVPELKFPKKQPKDKDKDKSVTSSHDDLSVTIASVDGSLRKIGEKDLLLQTGSKVVLRFRLLTKTQFRNKEGAPIRDSLLHPGDKLTIEANTDDEETALRVILIRNATPAERKTAEQPVEEATVRAPTSDDLSKPHTVTTRQASPSDSEPATASDSTSSATPPPGTEENAGIPVQTLPREGGKPTTDGQIIAEARSAAASFSSGLPNFLVEQATTRYFSQRYQSSWRQIDVVTADVAYVNGKEEYRNVRIDGNRVNAPPENSGTWTTGEFGSTLEDVLSTGTNARFTRRGQDHLAGRDTVIFDYSVSQEHSHWILVSPDGRRYNPAYSGSIWIDTDTGRVTKLEQHTTFIPPDFSLSRADCTLDYAFVRIGANTYLLPSGGENIACVSGSGACSRNVLVFRNYRKFTTDSVIKYFASDATK